MEPNQDNGNRISRKSFLRICGSVIAGGSILGVTGNLLWKMFTRPDDIFYGVDKMCIRDREGCALVYYRYLLG